MMFNTLKEQMVRFAKRWVRDDDGVAAMEASFIFPVMLVLLLGTYDLGNGILANQKAIRASQVTADLVTRAKTISLAEVGEAITAGQLALQPFPVVEYGVDIVSISFDDEGVPQIVERITQNMSPVDSVLSDVASLSEANSGVMMVTVRYLFEPLFSGFVINDIQMEEVAFAKGRKSDVVRFE